MDTDTAVSDTADYVDDAARDVVTIAGPDAGSYLQSQLAQEVRDLSTNAARWTFVLEPGGKVDVLARVQRVGDDTYELDTDAGFGHTLLARINRFKIRVDAEATLAEATASAPRLEVELARIAAGWPRMGHEIEPGSTIPATTGIVAFAVNFAKGCYPGQELVERMDSRGADAPMRLRIVDVDPGAAVGDAIVDAAGVEVGTITSVSGEGGIALGYVKRGHEIGRPPTHLA